MVFDPTLPRLGILGGSFNPLHVGHLHLAQAASGALGLNRLDILPAAVPPHKCSQGMLPYPLRVAMLQAAFEEVNRQGSLERPAVESQRGNEIATGCLIRIDQREGSRKGPSYSINTLGEYAAELPGWERFFLMGSIDLPTLPAWKDGLAINDAAHLAIYPREEDTPETIDAFLQSGQLGVYQRVASPLPGIRHCWRTAARSGNLLCLVEGATMPVSATRIRRRWLAGEDLSDMLPPRVAEVLTRHRCQVDAYWGAK